jgi:hypothetical protein
MDDLKAAGKDQTVIAFYEMVRDADYFDLPVEGFGCIVCVSSDGKLSLLSRMM